MLTYQMLTGQLPFDAEVAKARTVLSKAVNPSPDKH
jgi:hypothetical protein